MAPLEIVRVVAVAQVAVADILLAHLVERELLGKVMQVHLGLLAAMDGKRVQEAAQVQRVL